LLLSVRRHWPENVEYAKVRDVKYFNGPDLLHLFSVLVCTKRERMPVSVHWNGLYFDLSVSGYWLPWILVAVDTGCRLSVVVTCWT